MLDILKNIDKKKIAIIAIITMIVIFIFSIIISIVVKSKENNNNKINQVYLKAELIDDDKIKLEVEATNTKNINYIIEKSETLDFEKKEEVKGSNNINEIQVDTQNINKTTYYRVRIEDIETKEKTYSNVISISKKEEESEKPEEIKSEAEYSELIEIQERTDEKSSSKQQSSSNKEQNSSKEQIVSNINSEESSNTKKTEESDSSSKSSSSNKTLSSYANYTDYSDYDDYDDYDDYSDYNDLDENNNYNEQQKKSVSSKMSSSKTSSTNVSTKSSNKNTNTSKSTNTTKNTNTNIEIIDKSNYIELKSIKINTTKVELDISGKNKRKLDITLNPENATDKEVTWESENENIVKVDENGTITAISNGSTKIIAKVGKKQAKCTVNVITNATGIKIENKEIKIDLTTNKNAQVEAKVEPETATNNKITWTSADTKIAKIDSRGNITGVSNGSTKIIAKIGTITRECEVIVETSPKSIKLSDKNIELDINHKNQQRIEAEILPNTSNIYTKITWKSSNTKVATVDATGKVTAKGEGIATVTATIKGKTEIKTSAKVVVNSSISNITLNKKNISINLLESPTATLVAKLANGEKYKTATWKSSNQSVAEVTGERLKATITAVGAGKTTILLTVDGKTAICDVTVKKGELKLSKTNNNTLIIDGEKVTKINITNEQNAQNISYKSSNTNVATVDSRGVVTGKKSGTSTITVETNKGIGTCKVDVWYKKDFKKETFTYQNTTIGYFIFIPEAENINYNNGAGMIMDFPGSGAANSNWSTCTGFGGFSYVTAQFVYQNKKSEYDSIVVHIHGGNVASQPDALNALAGYLQDKYCVDRKRVSICGYSLGALQAFQIATFATKNNYKNLQFASITIVGIPRSNKHMDRVKKIRDNKVNEVPVYVVTASGDGEREKLESTFYVNTGRTNRLTEGQIGLFNPISNNVPFSSIHFHFVNTSHGEEGERAFKYIDNRYNLIKWILQQKRTTVY